MGLVKLGSIAVHGTTIKANASVSSMLLASFNSASIWALSSASLACMRAR